MIQKVNVYSYFFTLLVTSDMTPPATPQNTRVTSDIVVMSNKEDKKKHKKKENEPDYR